MKISDILEQKINEIQSGLPLKINISKKTSSFDEYLQNATDKITVESSHDDYLSAKNSLSKSNTIIPKDKEKLMELINTNINAASKKYGVDANLIRSVMKQESNFEPYSLSNAGAQGLMQLMPGTVKALNINDPWDIAQNIDGGTLYLRDQLKNFNDDLRLALAAYNAGPNAVIQYKGIPPYNETQDYVTKVLAYYKLYSISK